MNLTQAQQQAVDWRGNVLVVAGAGTGKTRTLVERCLSCLLDERPRVSLDEILMVTFTEAAAAEIRQRIRARLEEELARRPDEPHWQEQLALFETAHIGTLHSFCFQLVRQHFYELGLDPQISVLAEEEARVLAEETLDALLQRHYAGRSRAAEAVRQLIQIQGRGGHKPVQSLVLKVHHYTQTLPAPAGWIHQQAVFFASTKPSGWESWLERALAAWRARWLPPLELAASANALAAQCAAALHALPLRPSRSQAAACMDTISMAARECPRGERTESLKPLQAFIEETNFLLPITTPGETDGLTEDWSWVRGQMGTLLELVQEFTGAFSEAKRELGVVDFHDLEQHALQLLWDARAHRPTKIARQWRQKLRFVFVDEYQDINAAQDKIIEALSRDEAQANRFLVGDVKQSIYRFRLANPGIFQSYVEKWDGTKGRVVALTDNFRSREGILDFVNSVFTLLMRRELGGVAYDQRARLRFGGAEDRKAPGSTADTVPFIELHLRLRGAGAFETDDPDSNGALAEVRDLEEAEKEARLVAMRLQQLKTQQHPVWDEPAGRFRPVEWRDMAILLRAPAYKAESYAKAFARLGVPLQVARGCFYRNVEISDLLSLLQTLDNPLQDLPLLAVLHSPLVGLTLDELAAIRRTAFKTRFWTALVRWHELNRAQATPGRAHGCVAAPSSPQEALSPSQLSSETRAKEDSASPGSPSAFQRVSAFLERFTRWRRLARQVSLSRCLEAVLAETHYDDWQLTQPRGEERRANMQRLLGLAEQFDQFQRQGLFRFLRLVEAQQLAETEPQVAAPSEENAVRFMSIHQSKGLEFPVVIVADLAKPFNLVDLRSDIILDEDYGLCPQIKPPHTGKRYPSLSYWLARQKQKRELLGEELRLLYVAMTRARDTLLLSAAVSTNRFERIWRTPCEATTDSLLSAGSYADWLGLWFSQQAEATADGVRRNQVGSLQLTIHDESELTTPAGSVPAADDLGGLDQPVEPNVWRELEQRLTRQYRFGAATRQPAKTSVSVLRRTATTDDEEEDLSTPLGPRTAVAMLRSKSLQAVSRKRHTESAVNVGNAHHSFLEQVAIEETASGAQLKAEAQRLQAQGSLSADEAELLDFEELGAFWGSDLGCRIRTQARFVRRELPFTTRFSPIELGQITGVPAEPSLASEFVVVQGVVDLAVIMPQEIWVLDFKTDAVSRSQLSEKVRSYGPQLTLYARALARIYERPVTEKWLYFLGAREARTILDKP